MSTQPHPLIYAAPLLELESDFFKVGHTTTAALKGRRSKLRRVLKEPKLELYPIIVYPLDTPLSRVVIHERDLVWMVQLRSLPLFQHPTPEIKYEVVYFPTTPRDAVLGPERTGQEGSVVSSFPARIHTWRGEWIIDANTSSAGDVSARPTQKGVGAPQRGAV